MRDSIYENIINTTSKVKVALNAPRRVINQTSKVAKSVVNSLDVSKNDAKAKTKYDLQQEREKQIEQDAKESIVNVAEDVIDRVDENTTQIKEQNNPMQGVDEGGARRDKEELGKQLEASNLVLSKDPEKVNKMLTLGRNNLEVAKGLNMPEATRGLIETSVTQNINAK